MKKSLVPKILFLPNKVEEEVRMFFWLCYPKKDGWDWSRYTYRKHPELERRLKHVKNKKKFYAIIHQYIQEYYKEHKKELIQTRRAYKQYWDAFGIKFLKELSQHFETDWQRSHKIIRASVTIGSTCPRFLDSWSFWVGDKAEGERVRRICYHEIVHFLWFKKWQETFSNSNPKEFERPHLIWKLSEIMAPIILNYHPKIKNMGQLPDPGYEEFRKAKIGRFKLIPYFERFYRKHLQGSESFENFLKKIWDITLVHRESIEKI